MDATKIKALAEKELEGTDRFVVEVNCSPDNSVEVVIDSDSSVDIDSCVALSRALEASLDRDKEDFELSVLSAGIGRPLKLPRQYRKLIGSKVDVVLKDGSRFLATLKAADGQNITIAYTERRTEEGRKRKVEVEVSHTFALEEVKTVCEYLDFK